MKRICTLLLVTMLFACVNVQAQTEQTSDFAKEGTKLFNPQLLNIGYSNIGIKTPGADEDTDFSQVGFAASGGYAIMDGLFIVGQAGIQAFKFGDMKFSFISLGGGARYYLPNNFFGGAGLLLNHGKIKGIGDIGLDDASDVSSDLSTTLVDFRLEAGYAYFLLPSVALEPSISYGAKVLGGKLEDYDHKLKYSRFGINLGVSVFF